MRYRPFTGISQPQNLKTSKGYSSGSRQQQQRWWRSKTNAVIGYAGLTETMVIHEAAPWIDIHHLFVDEKHRNSGVGTALIKAAKSHALSRGAARLTIGTDPRNASAIAAYRKVPILREKKPGGPRFRVDLTS